MADDPKAEVGSFERKPSGAIAPTAGSLNSRSPTAREAQPLGETPAAGTSGRDRAVTIERCRTTECSAPIRWAKMLLTGNSNPIDAEPVANGNLVLSLRKGELVAEAFDAEKHAGRNRYVSHFATCARGAEWRRREPTQRDLELTSTAALQAEARKARNR